MRVRHALSILPLVLASTSALASFTIHNKPQDHYGSYHPPQAEGHASFRHSDASNAPRQARYEDAELVLDLAYSPVSTRGSGVAQHTDGFADSVPFASGMSMIIPRGWHLYRDKDLNHREVPQRISFDGGREWPDVLRDLGQRYTLHFHIDWYDNTVMMSKGRPMPDAPKRLRVIPEPAPVSIELAHNAADGENAKGAAASTSASGKSGSESGKAADAVGGTGAGGGDAGEGGTSTGGSSGAPAVAAVAPPQPEWVVTASDGTYREAITRWARSAKWTFEPEHWTVPVDLPLSAGATFRGDFKSAVQGLVATTELSETPLQPCFYSNKVVRVVPYNEMCDRALAR